MPFKDIPLAALLTIARNGLPEASGLPPTLAAEMQRTQALERPAQASDLIGLLPPVVAKTLAAVPDTTAATTDPIDLARKALDDAGGLAAPAGSATPLADGALEDLALYLEVRL